MQRHELQRIISQYHHYLQVEKGFAPSTYASYMNCVEYFFLFCSQHWDRLFLPEEWTIHDLGVRELEFFFREHMKERGWKVSTMTSYNSAIRSFFRFLHEKEFLETNPIRHFLIHRQTSDLVIPDIDASEISILFEEGISSTFEGYRNRCLLEFIYGLGIPAGKLLQAEDVEINEAERVVCIYFGRKSRQFPISLTAIEVLKEYLIKREKVLTKTSRHTLALFISKRGTPLSQSMLAQIVNNALQKIQANGGGTTLLRNLSSKHFAEKGADARSIQKQRMVKSLIPIDNFKKEDFETVMEQFQQMHIRNKPSQS